MVDEDEISRMQRLRNPVPEEDRFFARRNRLSAAERENDDRQYDRMTEAQIDKMDPYVAMEVRSIRRKRRGAREQAEAIRSKS